MKTIIVGLTVREAEHHWRELCETRPELRNGNPHTGRSAAQVMSVEQVIYGGLQGRPVDETEVLIHVRAWMHRSCPLLREALLPLEALGLKTQTIRTGEQ